MSNDDPRSLRDVARAALDKHPGSGRELDRKAKAKGFEIVYTTINAMAAGTYKSRPSRKTLEALAGLSGYSLEQVRRAANMPAPLTPLRDDLPPEADLLTGKQRRLIIDAVRLFAQQNRQLAELQSERDEQARDQSTTATKPHLALAADEGDDEPDVGAPEDDDS